MRISIKAMLLIGDPGLNPLLVNDDVTIDADLILTFDATDLALTGDVNESDTCPIIVHKNVYCY